MIPVNEPLLEGNEKKYLMECIETQWISSEGPFISKFEEQFSRRVGRKYGVAVANGTAALDIAVAALGIREGDEVIIPTFTIISCATAVVRAGGKPVLVDCDIRTWNMDVSAIEAKITSKTKAVMAVHLYGLTVDMKAVQDLCVRYRLKLIEDAAQAIGQTCDGKPCGSFGELSTFSFYPNKHITTGEGGMIATDDLELAERCRKFRNLCFEKEKRFFHNEIGWNYRMTNLQAAVGLAQLERLDFFLEKKFGLASFTTKHLKAWLEFNCPLRKLLNARICIGFIRLSLRNHRSDRPLRPWANCKTWGSELALFSGQCTNSQFFKKWDGTQEKNIQLLRK